MTVAVQQMQPDSLTQLGKTSIMSYRSPLLVLWILSLVACGAGTRTATVDPEPPKADRCSSNRQAFHVAGVGTICVSEAYADLLAVLAQVNLKDTAVGTAAELIAKASGKASYQGAAAETSVDIEDKASRSLVATYGSPSESIQLATAEAVRSAVADFRQKMGLPPLATATVTSIPRLPCASFKQLPMTTFEKNTVIDDECLVIPRNTTIRVAQGVHLIIVASRQLYIESGVRLDAKGGRGPQGQKAVGDDVWKPSGGHEGEKLACVCRATHCQPGWGGHVSRAVHRA